MKADEGRTRAARLYGHLIRDPKFRKMAGSDTILCLDSDTLSRVLDTVTYRYPDGAEVVVYFPRKHEFRFMTWAAGAPTGPSLTGARENTMGMVIAALDAQNSDWTNHVHRSFSTIEAEKQLADA